MIRLPLRGRGTPPILEAIGLGAIDWFQLTERPWRTSTPSMTMSATV